MIRLKQIPIVVLLIGLHCSSCTYDEIEPQAVNVEGAVSFSGDLVPIFEANCIECHSAGTQEPVLTDEFAYDELVGGSYINTSSPEESRLMKKLNSGHPDPLTPTEAEKAIILQWIEQGAFDN